MGNEGMRRDDSRRMDDRDTDTDRRDDDSWRDPEGQGNEARQGLRGRSSRDMRGRFDSRDSETSRDRDEDVWRDDANRYGDRSMQGGQRDRNVREIGIGRGRGTERDEQGRFTSDNRRRRSQGMFAGKGPKGYQRSDLRIKEDVNQALTRDADVDATEIEVTVDAGDVTLTGTVADRDQKRAAEDALEQIDGIKDIHNQLRVSRNEAETPPQQQTKRGRTSAKEMETTENGPATGRRGQGHA
jgi:osmotically-inducible protein OsmY